MEALIVVCGAIAGIVGFIAAIDQLLDKMTYPDDNGHSRLVNCQAGE